MLIDVTLPQLGESVTEGTISKWLVREGDVVRKDQPLVSIATDKADSEIPAPVAGVVSKVHAKEGEVVRLAYVEGRTNKEIAAQLGVSTRTVTRRLRLALQSMENQIGRAGGALSAIALLGFAGLSARFARIGGFLSKSIDGNQLAAATLVGATVVGTVAFVSLAPPLGAEPSFHAWQAGSAGAVLRERQQRHAPQHGGADPP